MDTVSVTAVEESRALPLGAFQRWLQQNLLEPYPETAAAGPAVEAVVNSSTRLSAREHLAIYQRSYIARLRHCMAQQFSALEYALGEELFRAFADDYLTAYPSAHYNLGELGRQFPAYLQANRPDALSDEKEDWIDFMIELAAFEYALSELFDRQAEEGYPLADAATAEADLALVPTATPCRFQFPIHTFYTRFKKDEQPELPVAAPSYCVVLRHDYKLAVYDLPAAHYDFLTLLAAGLSVPAAKAAFAQRPDVDAAEFARVWPGWKQHWLAANLLRTTGQ